MKILPLYTAIAESLGYTVEDDLLFYHDGDELQPTLFESGNVTRHIVIPTYDRIKAGFGDTYHPFHPLCESVIEGQSPTVKFLRLTLIRAIKQYGITLIDNFLHVACGKRKPRSVEFAKLKARVTDGIKDPKFDETLLKSWNKIKAEVIENPKMTRIHLGSNREVDGVKYARVCTYTHIFHDEADDKSQYFFNVKLQRKADKAVLVKICQEVFDSFPSEMGSSDPRPYFGCMMRAWREFVRKYNTVTHSFSEVHKVEKLNDEWLDEIDNLEKFENKIQTLSLNAGAGAKKKDTVQPLVKEVAPVSASELPTPASSGKVSLMDLTAGARTTNGSNLYNSREPIMSAAERRARQNNNHNHNSLGYTQQNTQSSLNNTPNMFNGVSDNQQLFNQPQQTSSMFGAPQQASNMFGAPQQASNMFGAPQQAASMFDAPQQTSSMFGTQNQTSRMFN